MLIQLLVIDTSTASWGGGMARRAIKVIFDDNLTDEQYADRGNGIWPVLNIAHPGGGFHLEGDGARRFNSSTTGGRSTAASVPVALSMHRV